MILSGNKIKEEVLKGRIQLDPFDLQLLNPNSYNYRLGEQLLIMPGDIDTRCQPTTEQILLPKEGYILQPGVVYLGHTYERIGSSQYVPSLIGRSSLGRLGLFLQITADLGHLGTYHKWTLEMTVVQPLRVYPRMRVGQVSFWKPEGLPGLAGGSYADKPGSYANYSSSTPSKPSKFFE
ncbi:MAG TPA: deoxycytidine deaminase [Verrucomicrobiae bacterium]|nr:deoxycytidine deaminase [Verrucomicrobiae bacterium]